MHRLDSLHPRDAHTPAAALAGLALAALLSGCAAPAPPATPGSAAMLMQLPQQIAWFEGRLVQYVTTDVSDATLARQKGANFAPRLRELLPAAGAPGVRLGVALERVYSFTNASQPTVFPSVPRPAGADNRDLAYSPLWRMVQVSWQPGRARSELRSEEAVLAAEERGDVRLVLTDVVLNCPVLAVEGDAPLRGVREVPAQP